MHLDGETGDLVLVLQLQCCLCSANVPSLGFATSQLLLKRPLLDTPSLEDQPSSFLRAGLQPEEEAWTVAEPSGQEGEDAGSAAS